MREWRHTHISVETMPYPVYVKWCTEKSLISSGRQTRHKRTVSLTKKAYLHKNCVEDYCATFLSLTSSRNHVAFWAEAHASKRENWRREKKETSWKVPKLLSRKSFYTILEKPERVLGERGKVWETGKTPAGSYCMRRAREKLLPVRFLIDQIKMIRWSYNHVI